MKKSRLCLVLTGKTLQENIENALAFSDKIDCVELRADFLSPDEHAAVSRFPTFIPMPAILTMRRKTDGGQFHGNEEQRRNLLKNGAEGDFAWVDMETDFHDPDFEETLRKRNIRIIRSFHDFDGVPYNLEKRIKRLAEKKWELPKAAVTPKSTAELVEFLQACKKLSHTEKILVGMGEYGVPTRILTARTGSFLSYCSMPGIAAAAPGHLDPVAMTSVYRFAQISKHTKVLGIIGNPISHSLSPIIHNRGLRDLLIDAVYVPFLVDDVMSFFEAARLLNVEGFSVTIPHKEEVIRFLKRTDSLVDKTGACNTVLLRGNHYIGTNTDIDGFLAPLTLYFKDEALARARVTVIGAGGAARACVYALSLRNAKILVINRTGERAKILAEEFGCQWASMDEQGYTRMKEHSDLVVQTTSVGMHPDTGTDPVPGYGFSGHELVYDLIYTPRLTHLLERAMNCGCKVINGEEMLVAQAQAQFELFTGKPAPFKNTFLADFLKTETDEEESSI